MTDNERDNMWMACLDGELSSAEASAFEASLTPGERDRLAAEMRFESALAEALHGDIKCPDAVWRRARLIVRHADGAPRKRRRAWTAFFAAAAAITVLFSAYVVSPTHRTREHTPRVLATLYASLDDFAEKSEVPATTEAVQAYLRENGINLRLDNLDTARKQSGEGMHHDMSLVGACEGECPDHTMQALLFRCCGRPVRLLVAPLGSGGAHMLQAANENNEVQRMAIIGKYVAAVVGDHPAPGLLGLLKEPPRPVV